MWRTQSLHERSETEYLDQAIERLEFDAELIKQARVVLTATSAQEPIIKASLRVPQDPLTHAEGAFMDAHLMRMLIVLYGITQEKLHLIDIEEFRRMKGYEGEIDELEEIMKEKIAFFETFILVHDVAKMHSIEFLSPNNSRGERLGINSQYSSDPIVNQEQRNKLLAQYQILFDRFLSEHVKYSDRDLQKLFFETNEIRISYPHHDRMMYAPVQQDILKRVATAHELSERDHSILSEIVGRHLEFGSFKKINLSTVHWLLHLAKVNGYDGDDFLDLAEGCIFLDWVCGSMRTRVTDEAGNTETFHDPSYVINALISEHKLLPERRLEKIELREQKKKEERNRYFQEVGLDGEGLMKLFQMSPGSELGKLLRSIQQSVLGQGTLPKFSHEIDKELEKRITAFYNKLFVRGD